MAQAKTKFFTGFEWWEVFVDNNLMNADDAWELFEYQLEDTMSSDTVLEMFVKWEGGLASTYQIRHVMSVLYAIEF